MGISIARAERQKTEKIGGDFVGVLKQIDADADDFLSVQSIILQAGKHYFVQRRIFCKEKMNL